MYTVSEQTYMNNSKEGVEDFLTTLGLIEYLSIFVSEGFDTIQAIGEITEDDLEHMQVKRGHRRILQRALGKQVSTGSQAELNLSAARVADFCCSQATPDHPFPIPGDGYIHVAHADRRRSCEHQASQGSSLSLNIEPYGGSVASCGTSALSRSTSIEPSIPIRSPPRPKRKYRRHPKPDTNAPQKPFSAYVMFTNTVREELKGQRVSFTEIAKLVGERWKNLDPVTKETFERKAAEEKEHWDRLMRAYKTTPQYAEYRDYLRKFRETHPVKPTGTYRKASLELNENSGTGFDSQENNERLQEKEIMAVDNDEWATLQTTPVSASPSERSLKSFCSIKNERDDETCDSPGQAFKSYQLPPLLSNNPRTPPTIPHLSSLDRHLSEAQACFFKSQSSLSAYYDHQHSPRS